MERNPLSVTPPQLAGHRPRQLQAAAEPHGGDDHQARPEARSDVSGEGGHRCHPCSLQRCDGTDPYDGLPQDNRLHDGSRSPTVSPVSSSTTATFEILSLQTKEAKGERNGEEFIAHCRAVVAHADASSQAQR